MTEDKRRTLMKERFKELSFIQLASVLQFMSQVLTDDANFKNGNFCPLAIARGVHSILKDKGYEPSDDNVRAELSRLGYDPVNILKGVEGEFYHGNDYQRRKDLEELVKEIISEKKVDNGYKP